jgi:hypothetical protein
MAQTLDSQEYLTAFHYLGKSVGSDTGLKLALYAKALEIKPKEQIVEGASSFKVKAYPRAVLDSFFNPKTDLSIIEKKFRMIRAKQKNN